MKESPTRNGGAFYFAILIMYNPHRRWSEVASHGEAKTCEGPIGAERTQPQYIPDFHAELMK